jgi:hypothetical protein
VATRYDNGFAVHKRGSLEDVSTRQTGVDKTDKNAGLKPTDRGHHGDDQAIGTTVTRGLERLYVPEYTSNAASSRTSKDAMRTFQTRSACNLLHNRRILQTPPNCLSAGNRVHGESTEQYLNEARSISGCWSSGMGEEAQDEFEAATKRRSSG